MRASAMRGEEKRGQPAARPDGCRVRCARVTEHRSLAVIKLARSCERLEPALSDCLRDIAGVVQVQIDSSRGTIQLLYEGEQGTVESIHRFLLDTGWK